MLTHVCSQHLRVIYEGKFETLKTSKNKKYTADLDAYAKITSKSEKGEGESPHSVLLRDANLIYYEMGNDPLKMWNPSQYAFIRNIVLRSKNM